MGERRDRAKAVIVQSKRIHRGMAGVVTALVVTVGLMFTLLAFAVSQVAVYYDPGTTATPTGVTTKATDATAGTTYVQFGTGYCGYQTFPKSGAASSHCIGAAEMATHQCIWPSQATNDCAAGGFTCLSYNSNVKLIAGLTDYDVYNFTTFSSAHSGGVNEVRNSAICGKDFYPVLIGTIPDPTSRSGGGAPVNQTVPSNAKHTATRTNTQSILNSYKTGDEYDPGKP